jgi:hypothetical protein
MGLGFELRDLHLQTRHFTTWAMPLVHFALGILGMGSHELFAQAGVDPCSSWSQPPKWLRTMDMNQWGSASRKLLVDKVLLYLLGNLSSSYNSFLCLLQSSLVVKWITPVENALIRKLQLHSVPLYSLNFDIPFYIFL